MASTSKKTGVKTLKSVVNSAVDHQVTSKGASKIVDGRETTHKFLNVTRNADTGALQVSEMQASTARSNLTAPDSNAVYQRKLRIGGDYDLLREWYDAQDTAATNGMTFEELFSDAALFTPESHDGIDAEVDANLEYTRAHNKPTAKPTVAEESQYLAKIMAWSKALATSQDVKSDKASTSKKAKAGSTKKTKDGKARVSSKRGLDGLIERFNNLEGDMYLKVTEKFNPETFTGVVKAKPPTTERGVNQGQVWHIPGIRVFSADSADAGGLAVVQVLQLMGVDIEGKQAIYEKIPSAVKARRSKSGSRPGSPTAEVSLNLDRFL